MSFHLALRSLTEKFPSLCSAEQVPEQFSTLCCLRYESVEKGIHDCYNARVKEGMLLKQF